MFFMSPMAWMVVMLFLTAYVLIGYGMVGAAHAADPEARAKPQIYHFFGVLLWAPIAFAQWRRHMRHRARLRPRG